MGSDDDGEEVEEEEEEEEEGISLGGFCSRASPEDHEFAK